MTTDEKIDLIYEKLFEGNGEPSIMSRMTKLETCVCALTWFSGLIITSTVGMIVMVAVK